MTLSYDLDFQSQASYELWANKTDTEKSEMHKTQTDSLLNVKCWLEKTGVNLLLSEMVRSSAGREFHDADAGPEKEKARSPNLVRSRGVV